MLDTLTHLLALAARLEGEGQYNNAKLLRAAADSLLTRGAHRLDLPTDKAALLAETDRAIESLSVLNVGADLMTALHHARTALAEGRLPRVTETPDPFVCRACGHLTLGDAATVPANLERRVRPHSTAITAGPWRFAAKGSMINKSRCLPHVP